MGCMTPKKSRIEKPVNRQTTEEEDKMREEDKEWVQEKRIIKEVPGEEGEVDTEGPPALSDSDGSAEGQRLVKEVSVEESEKDTDGPTSLFDSETRLSNTKVDTRDTDTIDNEEVLRIEDTELYKRLDNATSKERWAQMEKYNEILREEGNEQDMEEDRPHTSHNVGDREEGGKYDNIISVKTHIT